MIKKGLQILPEEQLIGTDVTSVELEELSDGSNTLLHTHTMEFQFGLDYHDDAPSRDSETGWHGGINSLITGQPLDSVPTNIIINKGTGKILIVINAGSDISGEIVITGESVDRDTGVETPADTDTISVDSLTTDSSIVDTNGNAIHTFTDAYISSKWFQGSVTLSTSDLTLTDVDIYHYSFEQNNDQLDITIDSFDVNLLTTNVNAEFDAYLYTVHVTGDKCNIDKEAELHIGADGPTAIANRYWRRRLGNIDEALDGTTDGWWVDFHYSNSPAYVEDITATVWFTRSKTLT